jgi:beta-lactamase class D
MRTARISRIFLVLFLFALIKGIFPQNATENKYSAFQVKLEKIASQHLQKLDAAFVLYDFKNNQYARHNPERCRKPYPPCSTFKIANTLIAMETGVADGPEFMIPFDSTKTPPQDWWAQFGWLGNQTLRSAMKNSVVWYYQEIARRIGSERMRHFLSLFKYGNQDISGGIDQFWLMSSLLISPDDQLEFLKQVYQEKFKLSKHTYQTVKSILLFDEKINYRLYAKTGGGTFSDGKGLGWFVGFVERQENVFFFVLNLEDVSFLEVRKKRIDLTLSILSDMGILDGN